MATKEKLDGVARDAFFIKLLNDGIWTVDPQTGTVYNNKTNRVMNACPKRAGNTVLNYMIQRKLYSITKNRLVWISQKGIPKEAYCVVVKDKTKIESIDNLEAISPGELRRRNGLASSLERAGVSALEKAEENLFTSEYVLALRREYTNDPFSIRERCSALNISREALTRLLTGKTFINVPEPCTIQPLGQVKSGVVREPLTEEEQREKQRLRMVAYRASKKPKEVKEVKPPKPPKSAVVKVEKPKPRILPRIDIPAEEVPVVVDSSYEERRKLRQRQLAEQEELLNQRELERLDLELAKRKKEKLQRDRILAIRRAAEKLRNDKKERELSPFKQFAVFHLCDVIEANVNDVIKLLHIDKEQVADVMKNFPRAEYETRRLELIEKFGRDSKMLSQIRLFEGDIDHAL
jgi:hypothetical protein